MSSPRGPKPGFENISQDVSNLKITEERKELASMDNPKLESIIKNLLDNSPSVQTLHLDFRTFNTDLDSDEKAALYYAISNNKSMKYLTLQSLELDDNDAKALVGALTRRKSDSGEQLRLEYLSLSYNKFTVNGTKVLATAPVDLICMVLTKMDDEAALSFVNPGAVIPKVQINHNLLTAAGVKNLIEQNKKTQIVEWDSLATALVNPYVGDQADELRAEFDNLKQQQSAKKATP
jgi:hypothetical protein